MTSKVSCFKMTMNTVKRRLWYGAVLFLAFFIGFPLRSQLVFQNREEFYQRGLEEEEALAQFLREQDRFLQFLRGGSYLIPFLVIMAALLGAWSGMYWFHSRKKMDLLGALPVRREKIYLTEGLATVILFLVPYLSCLLLTVLVGAGKGLLGENVVLSLFVGIAAAFVYFCLFYVCGTAAMLLTGKLLCGILGTMVFLGLTPAIYSLVMTMPELFFQTYYARDTGTLGEIFLCLSPACSYLRLTQQLSEGIFTGMTAKPMLVVYLMTAVMLLFYGSLSLWLSRIRPAESAESAMAFPKTEGVIKAVILYPLGLGGGLYFRSIGRDPHFEFWFWFGIVFTLLISSVIIEVIYHFDRRRVLDHKLWTGLSLGAVLLTGAVFVFDLTGYDRWLPDPGELANGVLICNYEVYDYPDGSRQNIDYLLRHMGAFSGEGILELADEGVANLDRSDWVSNDYGTSVTVLFRLNNGKIRIRRYYASYSSIRKAEKAAFDVPVYREAFYPMLTADPQTMALKDLDLFIMGRWVPLQRLLTEEELRELFKLYQEELRTLDYDEIYSAWGGTMEYCADYHYYLSSPVNEHFVNTVRFLRERGISLDDQIPPADIQKVTIIAAAGEEESGNSEEEAGVVPQNETSIEIPLTDSKLTPIPAAGEVRTIEVTDPVQIEEIVKDLIYPSDNWRGTMDEKAGLDKSVSVSVDYVQHSDDKSEDGQILTCSGQYREGEVPQIIETLLKTQE